MNVDKLIDELIEREGDYVDHPADRGGPTRWGITEAVARRHGYTGAISRLPRERAALIYRMIYWESTRFDDVAKLAPKVAEELFDTGVNMGPTKAVEFLQRALNALNRGAIDYPDVLLDGRIGPATLGALEGYLRRRGAEGEAVLVRALEALQGARYIALAEHRQSQEAFVYGWLANRLGNVGR